VWPRLGRVQRRCAVLRVARWTAWPLASWANGNSQTNELRTISNGAMQTVRR
jgi:hypothetical protein